ncbi:MAG: hypothetical protein ACSHW0_19400 [Thalassotalea sp.]
MKIDNIDAFNITAMELFHKSLDGFPIPVQINHVEFAKVVFDYFKTPECSYEATDSLKLLAKTVRETIIWLESEGFLRRTSSDDALTSITITNKGLNAINAIPTSIKDNKSFKEIFKSGFTQFSVSTATGLMVEFFKASS